MGNCYPLNAGNLEFFYGSVVNSFWNILANLSNLPATNVKQRFAVLEKLNFGLTDILQKIERYPDNNNADSSITNLNYNKIFELKSNLPNLKNIFITSGGRGPVGSLNNSKSVATWFKDSVRNNKISGFNSRGFVKKIKVDGTSFNLIYLFSPSDMANISIKGILNKNEYFGMPNLTIESFRKFQWAFMINKFNPALNLQPELFVENNALNNFFLDVI